METLQGEGGPRTIADEALEARAVVGLDTDTAIQTEPSAVVPDEHVLGVMGLQQAVAAKVTKDPLANGVLEAVEELGRETGGFVEAEATGLGFGVLIHFGGLEQAVHHTEVEVIVGIERRAEPVLFRMSECKIPLMLMTDRYTAWWIQHRFRRTRKELAAVRQEKINT